MTEPSPHIPDPPPRRRDDDDRAATLARLEQRANADEALAFFDSLPPMPADAMIGAWKGSELATGHPFDGMLALFGWHGKRFEGPEAVHPLVMGEPGALFCLDPSVMPLGWVRRNAALIKTPAMAAMARNAMRLFQTREPKARLRMTEFRGVTSATMVYDALPVNDIFRKVDDATVLGLMDIRGEVAPGYFFFVLRREGTRRG